MTDEEIVKRKYPDADYHEESKWWESGVWRKGIVPILLGKTWSEAREKVDARESQATIKCKCGHIYTLHLHTVCPECFAPPKYGEQIKDRKD